MVGEPKQPGETWDEYCDRVDREVRAAGEKRYPLGFTILIYLLSAALVITALVVLIP
jgi:hypothetical protein